jgi:hypothetical protein
MKAQGQMPKVGSAPVFSLDFYGTVLYTFYAHEEKSRGYLMQNAQSGQLRNHKRRCG